MTFSAGNFVSVRISRIYHASTDLHHLPCIVVEHLGNIHLFVSTEVRLNHIKRGFFPKKLCSCECPDTAWNAILGFSDIHGKVGIPWHWKGFECIPIIDISVSSHYISQQVRRAANA